jgi:peptidoglycan/LPS O-acetylase OafA/YrhL
MATGVSKRLDYIDLLRVIALGSVIAFHYLYSAIARGRTPNVSESPVMGWAQYGYLGVELFFMITGFVMIASTQNISATKFLSKRFFRLFPLYWLALILIFVISQFGLWNRPGAKAEDFYYALTMAPTAFGHPWLDPSHWFLKRLLQFYVFIFVILLLRLGRFLPHIFVWWSLVGLIWHAFGIDQFEIWYFNGFFALIAGGAIIYSIGQWGVNQFRMVGLLASYLWALSSRIDFVPWLDANRGPNHSPLVIGTVVTVMYLVMLSVLNPRVSKIEISGIATAAAITYPLFLIHNRIGSLVIARYATPTNQYFIYVLVTIVLIALAYGMLKLEGKIMRRIQKAGK